MKVAKVFVTLLVCIVLVGVATTPVLAQPARGGPGGGRHHPGHHGGFAKPGSDTTAKGDTTTGTTGTAQAQDSTTTSQTDGTTNQPAMGDRRGHQPTAEQKAKMEARLKEWATKNGYTTETGEDGRLVVKDKDGNLVRPPHPDGDRPEPTAEQKAKFEAQLKDWAAKNGYTTETGEDGRLVVKDKDGNLVKPPRPGHQPPSAEEIAKIEAKISAWAQENGYTTEKDEQGRLVAKDKDGKIVMPPPEVIGHPPMPPKPPETTEPDTNDTTTTDN